MPLKFKVKTSAEWQPRMSQKHRAVAEAAVAALKETAENAVTEGRRDIASAGRFGTRWQTGLQSRLYGAESGGEPSLQARALIFHRIGLAGQFEHGATIVGKPLLWIPTVAGAPAPSKSGKKLVSATVRGRPMLFDANDRDRARKPLYIGVPEVRIPKKWHITEIAERQVEKIALLFIKHFKDEDD